MTCLKPVPFGSIPSRLLVVSGPLSRRCPLEASRPRAKDTKVVFLFLALFKLIIHESNLQLNGIQVDSATGALKAMTGCTTVGCGSTETFAMDCTLTAHQGKGLNATAKISVIGTKFAYKSFPVSYTHLTLPTILLV